MVDMEGVIHSNCVSKWHRSRESQMLNDFDEEIFSFTSDKGYDPNSLYRALLGKKMKAKIVIDSRVNAVISSKRFIQEIMQYFQVRRNGK
jgi:hypothetical protein